MKRALALVAALVPIASCGAPDDGRTQVTFAVADQTLSPATAAYASVPETLGYYGDEGLRVDMQPVDSAVSAVQAVANGRAMCTYAATANAVTAIADDPGLTIVGTVNGNIFRTIAPAGSGVGSMDDLEGLTVGVARRGSISEFLVTGGMASEGAKAGGDTFLAVGYGAQAAEALRTGDVDVYSGYDASNLIVSDLYGGGTEEVAAETDDLTATSSLVCRADDVRERPETVSGLFRAFFKGAVFAAEDPRAAVEMHWERFPANRLAGAEASDLDMAAEVLRTRMEISGGAGTAGLYGLQDDADFQHTLDVYREYGVIGAPAEVADITDYSLVEEYNDFDPDEPREAARAH